MTSILRRQNPFTRRARDESGRARRHRDDLNLAAHIINLCFWIYLLTSGFALVGLLAMRRDLHSDAPTSVVIIVGVVACGAVLYALPRAVWLLLDARRSAE